MGQIPDHGRRGSPLTAPFPLPPDMHSVKYTHCALTLHCTLYKNSEKQGTFYNNPDEEMRLGDGGNTAPTSTDLPKHAEREMISSDLPVLGETVLAQGSGVAQPGARNEWQQDEAGVDSGACLKPCWLLTPQPGPCGSWNRRQQQQGPGASLSWQEAAATPLPCSLGRPIHPHCQV